MLAPPGELIAEPGECRRRRSLAPVSRQISGVDLFVRDVLRNLGDCQDKIRRGIIPVEVDEVLEHRQRLMFGGITEAGSRA